MSPTAGGATTRSEPTPALARRAADLRALSNEHWDVIVVGGGIVGAGCLLDAVSRGLRVALVEQDDLAVGTSSRSSRLIHGGLRYLELFDFGLVREALAERRRLLRLAPHLVRLEPFLFPIYSPFPFLGRAFYGTGLTVYDVLGAARDGGRARHLGRDATLERAPVLRRSGLRGGIVYHDGVADDARLVLAATRTAVARGALAVTRVRASGLLTDNTGRVRGVRVLDRLSATEFDVAADWVIDATGVWAASQDNPFDGGSVPLTPSRGSHVLVARDRIPLSLGLTIRVPGRVVFLIPWPRCWIIGTTDVDTGPPDRPVPTLAELDELLGVVNRTLEVDLRRADLLGAYAGLRPLIGAAHASTVRVSREHRVAVDRLGLVRLSGGKLTTYRIMARDAVDAALDAEARRRPSATDELPVPGAADPTALADLADDLVRRFGMAQSVAGQIVARHGLDSERLTELGSKNGLLRPLGPAIDALEAEVAWAVREEFALSLDDVLARRLRLAAALPDRGAAIAGRVAVLVGGELGWDEARQRVEVETYLRSARRECDVPLPRNGRAESVTLAEPEPHEPRPAAAERSAKP